jgi:ArsR family transcriptional regulator
MPARATELDDRVYQLHAGVCQILANPTRLKILNALRDQEVGVAELARRLGTSRPNLSQHLAILRQRGVVLTRREGVSVSYRLANPKILKAFDIMREVLFEQLLEGRQLVKQFGGLGARRSGSRP